MTHPVIEFWERRYQRGGTSGRGSSGRKANRKAGAINRLIETHHVHSVIDWGCGDGIVAAKIIVPRYIGVEVSEAAVEICKARADGPGREWYLYDGMEVLHLRADLALSLDVIFHLVDDAMYRRHLELLFASAPLVCIASSNRDEWGRSHVRHRRFTEDIPAGWTILRRPPVKTQGKINYWIFRRKDGPD